MDQKQSGRCPLVGSHRIDFGWALMQDDMGSIRANHQVQFQAMKVSKMLHVSTIQQYDFQEFGRPSQKCPLHLLDSIYCQRKCGLEVPSRSLVR